MKRPQQLVTTLLATLAAVLALPLAAAPAVAKGATEVVVSGPGIDRVTLGFARATDDVDVGSLAEVSGVYYVFDAAMGSDAPDLDEAALGPRYRLTWYVGRDVMAVTDVFPFAANGAWTHLLHEDQAWVRGGPALERAMVELGATRPETAPEAVPSTAAAALADPPAPQPAPAPATPVAAWVLAAAGVALAAAVGGWLLRGRRTPHPVRPV